MIKRLGPHGAADLHRKMTEQIICTVEPILEKGKIQLQIYYCGGLLQEMETWLGRKHSFHIQQGNDLGQRMAHAFVQTRKQGFERILLIGSDCPDITADIITNGLEQLNSHDLVLGPAADGGYYLIGLSDQVKNISILFQSISWGTGQVLAQTVTQAEKGCFSFSLLPQLHDIDRPEDLVYLNYHTCI